MTGGRGELPTKDHRGALLDARLHLLDRQLLGPGDEPVGIVDDLEVTGIELDRDVPTDGQAPRVTGILSGQVLATRIFGGRPPRSRLQEIPWRLVSSVGVVVRLAELDVAADVSWVERWLCEHVIRHIPGGRHAAE